MNTLRVLLSLTEGGAQPGKVSVSIFGVGFKFLSNFESV